MPEIIVPVKRSGNRKGGKKNRKHGRQFRSAAHQKYVSHGIWLEHKLANAKRHPESLSIPDEEAMDRMHPYVTKKVSLEVYEEYVREKANKMRDLSNSRAKFKV